MGIERVGAIHKAKSLVMGLFYEKDITLTRTENYPDFSPEQAFKVIERWRQVGWTRTDGLVRMEGIEYKKESRTLGVKLGKTSGLEYVGCRRVEDLRQYGYDRLPNPIACSVALVTKDGKLVFTRRLEGDAIGSIDAIAGWMDPKEDAARKGRRKLSLFKTARREVMEETGIKRPQQVQRMKCLGVSYEYADLCHPVVHFIAETPLTSEQLLALKGEEVKIIAMDPKEVRGYLKKNGMSDNREGRKKIEPDGRVTLALALRQLEGKPIPQKQFKSTSQL